jgi:hypothetical protein
VYDAGMARWCTVTVVDAHGKRHSMDLFAQSTYDAAHLYVTSAKSQEAAMMPSRVPVPTVATVFEVVADGKIFHISLHLRSRNRETIERDPHREMSELDNFLSGWQVLLCKQ